MRTLLFIVIAFAILWATATTATTPTAPTQVENVLDPTIHPYQQFGTVNCTFAGDCSIVFPAITFGRTLIRHVSCDFELSTAGYIGYAQVGSRKANPRDFLQPFVNWTNEGNSDFAINADTYLIVEKADVPIVEVFANNAPVQDLLCTVTGYYL